MIDFWKTIFLSINITIKSRYHEHLRFNKAIFEEFLPGILVFKMHSWLFLLSGRGFDHKILLSWTFDGQEFEFNYKILLSRIKEKIRMVRNCLKIHSKEIEVIRNMLKI